MKHWTLEEIAAGTELPSDVLDIVSTVLENFGRHGAYAPRLVHVGQHDDDEDYHRLEALVELAPGMLLPVEHGLVESLLEGWEQEGGEDQADFLHLIVEGVEACMPMLPKLADILHDARVAARRVVAAWNADGIPTRLIDVRLAPYDHWCGSTEPKLLVLIENLNNLMEPEPLEVHVDTPAKLEGEMVAWREDVAAAYARRTDLAAKGATGTIDQVAINALAHFGELGHGIRRLATEWRYWLPDDTAIIMINGHAHAGIGGLDGHVQWNGAYVSVGSTFIPADQLRQAIGRPLSELLEHDFLSDDIIVLEATCSITDGQPALTIKVDMPQRLFCSVSGRVWDDVQIEARQAPGDPVAGCSVVPFLRRR